MAGSKASITPKKYVKCSRCELNYMKEGEEYCDVCKNELRILGTNALIDEEEETELCPICGQVFIKPEQTMCDDCAKKGALDEVERDDSEEDFDVKAEKVLMNQDDDDLEIVSLTDLQAEEDADIDDEEDADMFDDDSMDDDDLDFSEEDFDMEDDD